MSGGKGFPRSSGAQRGGWVPLAEIADRIVSRLRPDGGQGAADNGRTSTALADSLTEKRHQ